MLNPSIRENLENELELEPQERGYEVLLIEPYYKKLLELETQNTKGTKNSPIILTYLDLYHFPLRGTEQAEDFAEKMLELKKIYKKR